MKIIHIALGKANPQRMNGVNKVVYQLANTQVEIGCDAEVWGITPTPDAPSIQNRAFKLELFRKRRNPLLMDKKLIKKIKTINDEVIFHFHGGFIPHFFSIAKLLQKKKLPYILTPHGNYNPVSVDKNRMIKTVYTFLFEHRLIKGSKALHFMGQSEFDAVSQQYPKYKKFLIPNGQDLFDLKKLEYKKSKKLTFSFIGRIDIPMKGLDILLKSFAKYLKVYDGIASLDIIGDGGEIKALKELSERLEINNSINFKGAMFGAEKLNALANSNVFFHPSRNEGLPGSILEAASLGLPCVVSKATNMGDYIDKFNAGTVLDENTEIHLAYAMKEMEHLFLKNELKLLGNNSRKMIEQDFSWTTIAKQHCLMYAS